MISARTGSPLRAVVLLAGLVSQAAADSYDIMGTVTVTADDAPLTQWVPFDREEQEPYATRMNAGG